MKHGYTVIFNQWLRSEEFCVEPWIHNGLYYYNKHRCQPSLRKMAPLLNVKSLLVPLFLLLSYFYIRIQCSGGDEMIVFHVVHSFENFWYLREVKISHFSWFIPHPQSFYLQRSMVSTLGQIKIKWAWLWGAPISKIFTPQKFPSIWHFVACNCSAVTPDEVKCLTNAGTKNGTEVAMHCKGVDLDMLAQGNVSA